MRCRNLLPLAVLLLCAVTVPAQRTPFKVNGTVVNNPNLTNTASITWTIVGPDVRGTSLGGSGDTLWTNDNGTISGNATVVDGASAVAFSLNSSNELSDGYLLKVFNNNQVAAELTYQGVWNLYPHGSSANSELNVFGSAYGPVNGDYFTANPYQFYIHASGKDLFNFSDVGASSTALIVDTSLSHTSGNLVEFKDNTILESWLTYDGISASTNGFASGASDSAVTIAATGWTNTFGKNAVVYTTGTNVTYTVYNGAGTAIYTNLTTTGVLDTSVLLQPDGKVIISGTAVFGRATPF